VKKTVLALGAALALSVMTAPTAYAQVGEPSCAEAQLAFQRAQAALDEAVAADEAAADAKAADEELARAERALEDAREAALSGGVPTANQTAADAARLRADLARLEEIPVGDRTTEQQARIDDIKDRLPLIEAVVSAEARVATARTEAGKTDADRLQDVADETDAKALADARETARKAADKACGVPTTTPPPDPAELDCDDFPLSDGRTAQDVLDENQDDPHQLDEDGDLVACEADDPAAGGSNQDDDPGTSGDVVTPSGGVATGGGPA
jgi:hypothetical protein